MCQHEAQHRLSLCCLAAHAEGLEQDGICALVGRGQRELDRGKFLTASRGGRGAHVALHELERSFGLTGGRERVERGVTSGEVRRD